MRQRRRRVPTRASAQVHGKSREASQEELARLLQQRGLSSVETRPVAGAGFGELDFRRVKDYFVRIRQQTVPADADVPAWETMLENTEFLARGEAGVFCTVAGLLLFGKRPNRFLPQAGIDAVSYAGTEADYSARGWLAPACRVRRCCCAP